MSVALSASHVMVAAGRKRILDDVSITLSGGEAVAVVGPNGAGKSTLLRVLSGELRPRSGEVRVDGKPLNALRPRELATRRAVLSQSVTVAFPFTVQEVVAMGAGDRRGASVDAMVAAALAEVDLAGWDERVFPTLSGGEQQRAHFARVLVQMECGRGRGDEPVLLLDEPTASLDLKHQLALAASAKRCAQRGAAVLAIMHDLNLASLFADRLVVLADGRLVADGPPRDVVTDDLLARIFGVRSAVGCLPPPDLPFVLPHTAQPVS